MGYETLTGLLRATTRPHLATVLIHAPFTYHLTPTLTAQPSIVPPLLYTFTTSGRLDGEQTTTYCFQYKHYIHSR